MTLQNVQSFICGNWVDPCSNARPIADASTGKVFAQAGNDQLDFEAAIRFAKDFGGPSLRKLTFHDRARLLKALAIELDRHKQALYEVSFATGATQSDHAFDIDGAIGTTFVYASKGRREMPDDVVLPDGGIEQLSRNGTFLGQHIYTSRPGVAVHINAFNFPVWGMLEKIAPCLLAGVPSIVKPATVTSYVTEFAVRLIQNSGLLPDGALQLISGGLGNTLDLLDFQDSVTFTGSAETARLIKQNPVFAQSGARFTAEQDSLNASIIGPDIQAGSQEFEIALDEAFREITTKTGQKCTAMRRILVPEGVVDPFVKALCNRLSTIKIGDPRDKSTGIGPLVSQGQKRDVEAKVAEIETEARCVFGGVAQHSGDADLINGAFFGPRIHLCEDPDSATKVHEVEAFGPVVTIMPFRDIAHGTSLANRGKGSLVASIITTDGDVAREVTLAAAPFHGRLYFNNAASSAEATGHGAPMPHMVHGGPGRAGGGEELGGIRGVKHFMQRTAIQGSPDILTSVVGRWTPGATKVITGSHPFTRSFDALKIGDTLVTAARKVTLDDIEHFAQFTGDTFYAHMDDAAAKRNPFFPGRVAHGYLLLSFAAGLFVEPNEGPVLANTGLDNLKFMQPVQAGDSISVELTVKHKTPRTEAYGEVRWHVRLENQNGEQVAEYDLLTMVSKS